MKVADLMTSGPVCCTPDESAQSIAQKMLDSDCGLIPVVDERNSRKLVGVVTDRDLALRCLARGGGPETKASEMMTSDVGCCTADAEAKDVERVMTDRQVRRVPIIDDSGVLVGIVAQADLARAAKRDLVSDREVGKVLEKISEPGPSAGAGGTLGSAEMRF